MRFGERKTINARVSLTYPSGNGSDERCVKLRIEDEAASITFVSVEIPFADWTLIQSASSAVAPTQVVGLELVGKTMEVDSAIFPPGDSDGAEAAQAGYVAAGWDSVEVRRRGGGGGYEVVARRWVDDATVDGE